MSKKFIFPSETQATQYTLYAVSCYLKNLNDSLLHCSGTPSNMLICLQHNAVVSENCKNVHANFGSSYKVDKSRNVLETGYLRLVPSAFWYNRRPGYLFTSLCQASQLVQYKVREFASWQI